MYGLKFIFYMTISEGNFEAELKKIHLCKNRFQSCHTYIPYDLALIPKWPFVALFSKKWKTYSQAAIRTLRQPEDNPPPCSKMTARLNFHFMFSKSAKESPFLSLNWLVTQREHMIFSTLKVNLLIFSSDNILRRTVWLSEPPFSLLI